MPIASWRLGAGKGKGKKSGKGKGQSSKSDAAEPEEAQTRDHQDASLERIGKENLPTDTQEENKIPSAVLAKASTSDGTAKRKLSEAATTQDSQQKILPKHQYLGPENNFLVLTPACD